MDILKRRYALRAWSRAGQRTTFRDLGTKHQGTDRADTRLCSLRTKWKRNELGGIGDHMDVAAYLQRIGYRGDRAPNAASLRALQIAHLQTVPFENLDIHLRRPIVLDQARLFEKIVARRRGGFC